MDQLRNAWNSTVGLIPSVLGGILLIIVAWLIATLIRQAVVRGLDKVDFDRKLSRWGAVQTEEQGTQMIDTLGQVFYYLVWVLFLPGILETFNLRSVAGPIQNMIDSVLSFLPNLITAILLVVVGVVVGRFVRNLVYNLALTLDVDRWVEKLVNRQSSEAVKDAVRKNAPDTERFSSGKNTVAKVLANIVFIIIIIPIVVVALEVLGIHSISAPIINVLNTILAAIPNILVAVILLGVGIALAKFIGDIVTGLLRGAGINRLMANLKTDGPMPFDLARVSGQVVAVLIGLFFFVEALNALNLEVLNTIGAAIIAYLPNVIFALIILGLGIIGGQWLGNLISQSSGSKWTGRVVQYVLIAFAVFMVLDQLNFASTIVNAAFIFIIGGLALAFALAFGIGGRDFARKQLEKLDDKVEEEANKIDPPAEL